MLPARTGAGVAGRVTPRDELSPAQWEALTEGLNRLGEATLKEGIKLALHPHAGTYVETRPELDTIMARTDPVLVGLCVDTGHLAYGGADPVAAFDDYAERIWHVHLKDVDRDLMQQLLAGSMDFVEAVRAGIFPAGHGRGGPARLPGRAAPGGLRRLGGGGAGRAAQPDAERGEQPPLHARSRRLLRHRQGPRRARELHQPCRGRLALPPPRRLQAVRGRAGADELARLAATPLPNRTARIGG